MSNWLDLLTKKVTEARGASLQLAQLPSKTKNRALNKASALILEHKEELLSANKKDIEKAAAQLEKGALAKPLFDRLKLDDSKIKDISKMVASVADLTDPVGRTLYSTKMDNGLDLFKVTVPFGVIVSIFEARPDALPQIVSLCIKSGNSVILKGGSEANESNRAMFMILNAAFIEEGLPEGCLQLIEEREAVNALLKMDGIVDLIIPRGSNEFVRFIQENTRIPVLGHSAGICHIFVDSKVDHDMAVSICNDARVQYPAACNSMKILLVDSKVAKSLLPLIARQLIQSGVKIKGCSKTMAVLKSNGIDATPADEKDWSTEYLDLTLPVKILDGVREAIAHINRYGSKHTDSIITDDDAAAKMFVRMVDSSTVIRNASTRFSDGYRYGLGAEVGISTNKVHARGPVGLEGLVTTKYILLGSGQRVADYVGKNAKPFLHNKVDTALSGRL
jgi:glutamate-5-semialdehyde dehydrogenase